MKTLNTSACALVPVLAVLLAVADVTTRERPQGQDRCCHLCWKRKFFFEMVFLINIALIPLGSVVWRIVWSDGHQNHIRSDIYMSIYDSILCLTC